jgi:hypothetical protein
MAFWENSFRLIGFSGQSLPILARLGWLTSCRVTCTSWHQDRSAMNCDFFYGTFRTA